MTSNPQRSAGDAIPHPTRPPQPPRPPVRPGFGAAPQRPGVPFALGELKREINQRARVVPVERLQQGGTRFVRVINTATLGQVVADAVHTTLRRYRIQLAGREREELDRAARAEVARLMRASQQGADPKKDDSVATLRREFQARLEEERERLLGADRLHGEAIAGLRAQLESLQAALRERDGHDREVQAFLSDGKLDPSDPRYLWKIRVLNRTYAQNLELQDRGQELVREAVAAIDELLAAGLSAAPAALATPADVEDPAEDAALVDLEGSEDPALAADPARTEAPPEADDREPEDAPRARDLGEPEDAPRAEDRPALEDDSHAEDLQEIERAEAVAAIRSVGAAFARPPQAAEPDEEHLEAAPGDLLASGRPIPARLRAAAEAEARRAAAEANPDPPPSAGDAGTLADWLVRHL